MARPKGTTKLEFDPGLAALIITYIKLGSYLETAAEAAGVHRATLHRWLKRGEGGEEPFASFTRDVKEARAEAELRDLARIDRAAETDWHASAWKLERGNPKRWGRSLDVTGKLDGDLTVSNSPGEAFKVDVDLSTLTPKELQAYEHALAIVAAAAVRSAEGTDEGPLLPSEI